MEAYKVIVSDINDIRRTWMESFTFGFKTEVADEIEADITVLRLVGRQAHRPTN